ncbi:MAG: hypothetical protein ACI4SG_01200 [Oligosphaeraceae bacterium]
MRTTLWLLWTLILGGFSLFAQENPEEILRKAILHDATLDYSYEDLLNGGNPYRIITVKQRRDLDGTIWYVREGKVKEEFRGQAWAYDTKEIYCPDGYFDIWNSSYEVSGIVLQCERPLHKIGKDSTFKMETISYEGKDCWKISEYRERGDVYEAIVDKETEFILADKRYDSSGRLEFSVRRKHIQFRPEFGEDDFRFPPNMRLFHARDASEHSRLSVERVERQAEYLIARRERMANITPTLRERWRRKWERWTRYDSFRFALEIVPWFLLPVSLCFLALGFWMKGRNRK